MAEDLKTFLVVSRIGPLFGAVSPRGLVALTLPPRGEEEFRERVARRRPGARLLAAEAEGLAAGRWLMAYLRGENPDPATVALDLEGVSAFSRAVLEAVRRIPYGHTLSYGEVARLAGHAGAFRATGQAVGANRLPILIPCHRVVGKDGSLTGFGSGLATKRALLDLEQRGVPLL